MDNMPPYEDILKYLKEHKLMAMILVQDLIRQEVLSFSEIAEIHNRYLQQLKEGQRDQYWELFKRATNIYFDWKYNRDKNIKDMMHWLLDQGQLNTTHEEIDKK